MGVRRASVAVGGSLVLLAGGALAGVAAADAPYGFARVLDAVVKPGGAADLAPGLAVGKTEADGTFVYAVSPKPLTGGTWAGGAPTGTTVRVSGTDSCAPRAGVAGVFTCAAQGPRGLPGPVVSAQAGAAHGTTVHYGVVYVPRGGSLADGVREAQTAGARPEDRRHGAGTVTVKTPERVAANRLSLAVPGLRTGGSVTQSVTVAAVDAGRLVLDFDSSASQRPWDPAERDLRVTDVQVVPAGAGGRGGPAGAGVAGGGADCEPAGSGGVTVQCDVQPGHVTVRYTLEAGPELKAWTVDARAVYRVYTDPANTGDPVATASFKVTSPFPVRDRSRLLARGKDGALRVLEGTGRAAEPFGARMGGAGSGWGAYGLSAKTAPVTGRGTGGPLVARDKAGVLWRIAPERGGQGFGKPTRIGAGWQVYDALAGTGDLTGDGRADLVAREPGGVLWLYAGTGKAAAPFAPRVRVGAGWQGFDRLVGAGDVTGDGTPDLLARDRAGAVWLYAGTGTAARPFAPKAVTGLAGAGLRALASPGDLTDDGRADLVTQDAAGLLWLHAATGDPAAPYAAPVKVDRWWDQSVVGAFAALL
ncbi:VCBS repeat-containing protein [Streptomyces sp. NPDC097619]|uniref:FG-GAP repeat domain-containing protein n=1 Tax=Streptomyces sp. NPDC097619 TaxID=3157228 RepID=UPI00331C1EA8